MIRTITQGVSMKPFHALAAAGIALFSSVSMAQLPPGITFDMINTTLPEEGAPKAIPGPYATATEVAFGNEGLKVVHPKDLAAFPKKDTLPVFVWGNGGCAMDNPKYQGFLETIASHGFLVINTRNAAPPAEGTRPRSANAGDLAKGIDWAIAENAREGSPLKGKIDTQHVAVMGTSCSGRLSLEMGADPRVSTIGVFNAGINADQMDMLKKLHGPVMFINGGERDFMEKPSRATFDALEHLPTFYGARHGAGHTATSYHVGGGEFANVATNWVRWQFKGDKKAAKMFVGKDCELCTNNTWDTASKKLK